MILSILIFLLLFITVLLIAITTGKKPTTRLNIGKNEKPSAHIGSFSCPNTPTNASQQKEPELCQHLEPQID